MPQRTRYQRELLRTGSLTQYGYGTSLYKILGAHLGLKLKICQLSLKSIWKAPRVECKQQRVGTMEQDRADGDGFPRTRLIKTISLFDLFNLEEQRVAALEQYHRYS